MHAAEDNHESANHLEQQMHHLCTQVMALALGAPAEGRVQAFAVLAAAAKVAAIVSEGQPRLAECLAKGFVVMAQALSPAAVTVVDVPAHDVRAH